MSVEGLQLRDPLVRRTALEMELCDAATLRRAADMVDASVPADGSRTRDDQRRGRMADYLRALAFKIEEGLCE